MHQHEACVNVISSMIVIMWFKIKEPVCAMDPKHIVAWWVINPDSKVHGANMGPIWGRQNLGGPHVSPMNLAIWEATPPTMALRHYYLLTISEWYLPMTSGLTWPKGVIMRISDVSFIELRVIWDVRLFNWRHWADVALTDWTGTLRMHIT